METNNQTNQNKEAELDLINRYTRKKLSEKDVYVFSVSLCDNDVLRRSESQGIHGQNKGEREPY